MQRFSTWLKEYIDDTFKCVCVPMCRRKVKANEHHDACFGLLHYIKGSRFVVDTYCGVSFFSSSGFSGSFTADVDESDLCILQNVIKIQNKLNNKNGKLTPGGNLIAQYSYLYSILTTNNCTTFVWRFFLVSLCCFVTIFSMGLVQPRHSIL